MEVFVPGRICLFGEHSDWAGSYRTQNEKITEGHAIIVSTNQGIHATTSATKNEELQTSTLLYTTTKTSTTNEVTYAFPLDSAVLLKEATTPHEEHESYFSYIAGVVYELITEATISAKIPATGFRIDISNFKTDLPIKKGLSSSAAICVLIVRCFNKLFDLGLDVKQEMDLAYKGEILTGSQCGRLDQGCAFGSIPIHMTFDRSDFDIHPIAGVKSSLYLVIVDLCASKDTKVILADLNAAYPFAQTEQHCLAQEYLGPINKRIVESAIEAIQQGDAVKLGKLMNETQVLFDKYLQPLCPSQLTAPVLHKVLEYPKIQSLIHGGKLVGSGGDGTAQLLAKDAQTQKEIIQILEADLQLSCLELTIKPTNQEP